MRKAGGILIIVFTILAVAAGFSLPGLTADYQDRQMMSQVRVYESEEIHFPSSYHVMDCIRLFSEGYDRVELTDGREHTAEEIREIAKEIGRELNEYGFFIDQNKKLACDTPTAFLAVRNIGAKVQSSDFKIGKSGKEEITEGDAEGNGASLSVSGSANDSGSQKVGGLTEKGSAAEQEENFSAIIWECRLVGEKDLSLRLWIDDLSGKMISARLDLGKNSSDIYSSSVSYAGVFEDVFYDRFVDFCSSYYGFETVDFDWSGSRDAYPSYLTDVIIVHLSDKSGTEVYVQIDFTDQYWSYNPA